jgi:lipoyl(octanoyl) transferase
MKIENWGEIPYQQSLKKQLSLVEKVGKSECDERLILCSHTPVVTLGKKGSLTDCQEWDGEIVHVSRGGKATYHGPGQLVIYPIINLKNYQQNISGYLEALEQAMVITLESYSLEARGNPERGGEGKFTGVWVNGQKVASIGVAVKRWVTYHGLAINLDKDPLAFQGIIPCGLSPNIMTSLEELINAKVDRHKFSHVLANNLKAQLESLKTEE